MSDGETGKGVIPDYPAGALALRVWRADRSLTLYSLNAVTGQQTWITRALSAPDGGWPKHEPGKAGSSLLRAQCKFGKDHDADRSQVPDPECRCGIYATTSLPVINGYLRPDCPVLGIVELGGTVIPADQGYRAQWARVAAILLIDEMFTRSHAELREIAAAYRVPAVVPHSTTPEDYRDLITPGRGLGDEAERYLRDLGGEQ
jgi:hypothetical protein